MRVGGGAKEGVREEEGGGTPTTHHRNRMSKPAVRPPPVLQGEDASEQQAAYLVNGRRAERFDATLRADAGTELSVQQCVRYTVVARREGWLQLRDELSGEIFYLHGATRKTCWASRKTPFRDDPTPAAGASVRAAKLRHYKSLLRKGGAGGGGGGGGGGLRPSPCISSRRAPSTAAPSDLGTPEWQLPRTPQQQRTSSASPSNGPGNVVQAASRGASTRGAHSVVCPHTGNSYTAGAFEAGLSARRAETCRVLEGLDIPPQEAQVGAPQRGWAAEADGSRAMYNHESRECFRRMMRGALGYARARGGEKETRRVDRMLQDAFADMEEEEAQVGSGLPGGASASASVRRQEQPLLGHGTQAWGGEGGLSEDPHCAPHHHHHGVGGGGGGGGGGGYSGSENVHDNEVGAEEGEGIGGFPVEGDRVVPACVPEGEEELEDEQGLPRGTVTKAYPMTGYCHVRWDYGAESVHKFPDDILFEGPALQ